jgi:hypothetical protein
MIVDSFQHLINPSPPPMLFQWQVINASFTSRLFDTSFHAWAVWALEQTNTKTCHVLMVAWCSCRPVENCTPWNMSFKTWTLKPTTYWNMLHFGKQSNVCLESWATQALKTCNVSGIMFWPYVPPIFHVPPCNPHPCPMTHT